MDDAKQQVKRRGFCSGHTRSRGRRLRQLTDDQVKDIYLSKQQVRLLARRYDVSLQTIYRIKSGGRKQLVTAELLKHRLIDEHSLDGRWVCHAPLSGELCETISRFNGLMTQQQVRRALLSGKALYTHFHCHSLADVS